MGTELNFTARLDTSQFLSQVDQARTQFGLAFGPSGMGMGAGGLGGVAQSQMQGMLAGLQTGPNLGGGGFGSTFTNPAIAYSPFYGATQATTQLDQEWAVHRYGSGVADRMKPPGVSSGDYMLGVEKNFINRQLEATHAANVAARSTLYSGLGGMVAGEAASAIATPLGALAGGAVASRLFGAGATAAGGMIGGLAAGWFAFDAASEFVGGKIQNHYAEAERIGGLTAELGEIAGSGRNLKRGARYDLGVAARQAAGDLKMDTQEMGDILALGRSAGMLPNASDPGKAREQYREFARAIEEGAQILGTSLAGATSVIKMATSNGMSAQEGVIRAAGMGADNFAAMIGFGHQGASVGRGMGYTGAQGSGIFTGALGGIGDAGMSGEEMRIMGGRFGAAAFVGSTQMQMARSPMGNLQLMAAMGGGGMGGMGMMDLPGAAIDGLMSNGGDFLSNAGKFMVHQNELRRGIGAGGIRAMSRAQLQMGGDMIAQFMPDMSANEAQRMYAQSMGLDPDQAKLLVGAGHGGGGSGIGGGMGGAAQIQAITAMQSSMLGNVPGAGGSGRQGFGLGYAIEGATAGAVIGGGLLGGIVGGAAGFLAGNMGAIRDTFFDGGPSIFAGATARADYDQRHAAAEYESRLAATKSRMGYLDIDAGAGQRFLSTNLSGARLDLDAVGSNIASSRTAGMMAAMGLGPVAAGAGTVKMGGSYISATGMQTLARQQLWAKPVTDGDLGSTLALAHSVGYGSNIDSNAIRSDVKDFVSAYETIRTGGEGTLFSSQSIDAGEDLLPMARRLIGAGSTEGAAGEARADLLGRLDQVGGIMDPKVRAALQQITGHKMESLAGAFMAGRGGAAAMKAAEDMTIGNEGEFLRRSYKGRGRADLRPSAADGAYGDMFIAAAGRTENPLPASFYKELQGNRHYLEAKEAIGKGREDEARKLMQTAAMEVQVAGGDKYRDLDVADIDPSAAIVRPGASELVAKKLDAARIARSLGMPGSEAAARKLELEATKQAAETTTWAKEIKKETDTAMGEQHKAKLRAMRPPTFERAVGFGEQESAMASINKSLKSTERTLAALEKKVAGMGSSPSGSPAPAGAKP